MQFVQPGIQGEDLLDAEIAAFRHAQLQAHRHDSGAGPARLSGISATRADAAQAQRRQPADRQS